MTTLDARPTIAAEAPDNYLTFKRGIMSWLVTLDHKRIGVMYLISVLISFLIGGIFALVLRVELFSKGHTIMDQDTYNRMFSRAAGIDGMMKRNTMIAPWSVNALLYMVGDMIVSPGVMSSMRTSSAKKPPTAKNNRIDARYMMPRRLWSTV